MADYYSLNELNGNGSLTADVGVSGAFIRLANQDRLIPLISDMKAYERAVRQDRELLAGLSNLNDPLWLAKWPLAHAKQFEAMIRKRAQRLEARRELVQRELDRLRLRLEAWSPGLVAELDHQFIDVPNLKLSTAPVLHGALRGRNLHVSERERVIFKYAGKSHLVICDELDDEFPASATGSAPQLPRRWVKKFGVRTFRESYLNEACRPLVHRLISGVTSGLTFRKK